MASSLKSIKIESKYPPSDIDREKVELKNTFWKSTLFNDVYLDHDMYRNHPNKWNIDGDPDFESCLNGLLNLFSEWEEDKLSGWTEADTVAHWIKPILVCLGWVDEEKNALPHSDQAAFAVRENGKIQTYFADILISDTVDDMSIYVDKKLTAEQRLEKAKGRVLIPLEAKYWNRINKQYAGKLNIKEEKEKAEKNVDAANKLGPNGQILKYMDILGLEWGILSDGATWRLFNKELSTESENRYLEFNIYNLYKRAHMALDNENDSIIFREATKFFYNFFSKKALYPREKKQELVRKVLDESKSYAEEVEEDLKGRFVNAMNLVCNGLRRASKSEDLDLIRTVAESHLFNILFIKSCEARNVLPLDANKYWEISLSRLVDALHGFTPEDYMRSPKSVIKLLDESYYWFEFKEIGFDIYDSFITLTKMIHDGTNGKGRGFHVDGFRESIYDDREWLFSKNNKLTNMEMVLILFELGFAKSPKGSKRPYQEIPYQFFSPRQLGSIYESFLEFKLHKATEDMAYVKKQWKKANLSSEKVKKMNVPKVKKGELFFTPDNKDRKATGSYYTPDYIVKYIVKETLEPLIKDKTSSEILLLNICDPAMGSGHFLSGALKFLTEQYLKALDLEILDDLNITPEEAKRIVLDKCIFGVDINERAVKLAKMSLWLESAHPGRKLERLDDQLRTFDSIVGDVHFEIKKKEVRWDNQIDAFVGNPPYLNIDSTFGKNSSYLTTLKEKYPNIYQDKTDLYYYFLGLPILKKVKRTGFIVSRAFVEAEKASNLRNFLGNNAEIERIIDFRGFRIFDAGITTAILFYTNKVKNSSQTESWKLVNESISPNELEKDLYRNNSIYFDKGLISNEKLMENYWEIGSSGKEEKIILKIDEKTVPLGSLDQFYVGQGMQTGFNKGFLIDDDSSLLKKVNKHFIKKRANNGIIHAFRIDEPKKYLIFPYGDKTNEEVPADIQKHLSSFSDELKDRAAFKRGNCEWDKYTWALHKELYNNARLICPYMAGSNRFALDKNFEYLGLTDTYSIFLKKGTIDDLLYLQGLLNSKVLEFRFHRIAKLKSEGVYEYFDNSLKRIPIKWEVSKSEKKKVVELVKLLNNNYSKETHEELNKTVEKIYHVNLGEIPSGSSDLKLSA